MRRVVVLPAPLGPRKPKISPASTSRSTPFTASTALLRLANVWRRSRRLDHLVHVVPPSVGAPRVLRCPGLWALAKSLTYVRYSQHERQRILPVNPDDIARLTEHAALFQEAAAERLGLNPTDLRCLALAAAEPGMTASRLGELSGLTSGAITGRPGPP